METAGPSPPREDGAIRPIQFWGRRADTLTMTYTETHKLLVCLDCAFLLANGEMGGEATEEETATHVAMMDSNWPAPWELCSGDSENDHDFSWSSCDACGSNLGGSRHEAWAMLPAIGAV